MFNYDSLLKYKHNGFMIEAGALDGEIELNSLFFELNPNYKGTKTKSFSKNLS